MDGYVRLVSDPLKAVIKLGRFDMYCEQHVKEYFNSFRDNNKCILNSSVRREVGKAAELRDAKTVPNISCMNLAVNFLFARFDQTCAGKRRVVLRPCE